jgi:hypothetical protein
MIIAVPVDRSTREVIRVSVTQHPLLAVPSKMCAFIPCRFRGNLVHSATDCWLMFTRVYGCAHASLNHHSQLVTLPRLQVQLSPSEISMGCDFKTIKPWLPWAWAWAALLIIPSVIYASVPVAALRIAYFFVSGSYAFVAAWVLLETMTALVSTAYSAGAVHMELDINQKRSWPEVTYIIPAYLNNEAPILDETCENYIGLEYAGVINVMIVYNTRNPMPDEEASLMDKWDGYETGNIRFMVVRNAG